MIKDINKTSKVHSDTGEEETEQRGKKRIKLKEEMTAGTKKKNVLHVSVRGNFTCPHQ